MIIFASVITTKGNIMKTLVYTHKGFKIHFDSNDAKFSVSGDNWGDSTKSFQAAKNKINKYIKDEQVFGSFDLVRIPSERSRHNNLGDEITVISRHANGNFIAKCKNTGNTIQFGSRYDLEKYCTPKQLSESGYSADRVKELNDKIQECHKAIRKENDKVENASEMLLKILEETKHLVN